MDAGKLAFSVLTLCLVLAGCPSPSSPSSVQTNTALASIQKPTDELIELRKMAEQGDAGAQFNLGEMYA